MCEIIVCCVETRSLGIVLFPVPHPGEHTVMWILSSFTSYMKTKTEMRFMQLCHSFLIDVSSTFVKYLHNGQVHKCLDDESGRLPILISYRNVPIVCIFMCLFLCRCLCWHFVRLYVLVLFGSLQLSSPELLPSNLGFRPHS